MQRIFLSFFALFLAFALPAHDAEAKRMGGGKSSGMQRQAPMKRDATSQQAQNTPGSPAQAPKRNWMGPLAGLAAGLGIAALMSHFGMGEAMGGIIGNILMMALLAFVVFMAVRWFRNRNKPAMQQPMQYAGQTSENSGSKIPSFFSPAGSSMLPGSVADNASPVSASFPPGFDAAAFVRQAKVNFIRMQTANDDANLADLREFTTPEMYAELKLDIDERNGKAQRTEVMMLNAEVLEAAEEGNRQIVSVRFYGTLREDGASTISMDEIWHMSKPLSGQHGWVVAGIQQNEQNNQDNHNAWND